MNFEFHFLEQINSLCAALGLFVALDAHMYTGKAHQLLTLCIISNHGYKLVLHGHRGPWDKITRVGSLLLVFFVCLFFLQ